MQGVAYPLIHYPEPVRMQILVDMEMLDICAVTQVDNALAQWMTKRGIWRQLWMTKIIPKMVEQGLASSAEDALEMDLGDDERLNCLIWCFECMQSFADRYKFVHDEWGLVRVTTYAGVAVNVEAANHEPLRRLERRFYESFYPYSGLLALHVKRRDELRMRLLQTHYALLSMGFHLIAEFGNRTLYI